MIAAKAAFKDLDTSNGRTLRKRTEKQTPKAAAPKKAPASKGKPKVNNIQSNKTIDSCSLDCICSFR